MTNNRNQFIHIELYARSSPRKRARRRAKLKRGSQGKWNIKQILGEAQRKAENSLHVPNPKLPLIIHGCSIDTVKKLCDERAEKNRYDSGRKIRKDTPILLAGVISYPDPMDLKNLDDHYPEGYLKFRNDSLCFLKQEYEDELISVVEHLDEKFPHLHFFAVPECGQAKKIHPGYLAQEQFKTPKAKKDAYVKAMQEYQDRFWKMVGLKNDMARSGPRRIRYSRKNYKEIFAIQHHDKRKDSATKFENEIEADLEKTDLTNINSRPRF